MNIWMDTDRINSVELCMYSCTCTVVHVQLKYMKWHPVCVTLYIELEAKSNVKYQNSDQIQGLKFPNIFL